ncbi:PhnA domain-containing protein [Kitasatospora sp. HPMI-4]|uniref:PhnA domain-containing protein n=1 Tax=Kitasatospora sp. HPMI-4 TaxID=3448443 RepID=UPI003F1A19BF
MRLAYGDSVTLTKDLKAKGTFETIKRGTLVKNIRLTGKPDAPNLPVSPRPTRDTPARGWSAA